MRRQSGSSTEKIKITVKINPSKCPYFSIDEKGNERCEFWNYIAVNSPGIVTDTIIDVEDGEVVRREKPPYLAVSFMLTNYPLYRDRVQPCDSKHCFGMKMPLFYQIMKECFESGVRKSIMVTEEIPEEAVNDLLNSLRRRK